MNNRVTAIVPAHNEENVIAKCINALKTNGCDEIIVANDNSTDSTYDISYKLGVTVFNTINNSNRKAGAINQALKNYVDLTLPNHYIFIVDADTTISDNWLLNAKKLIDSGQYDAVGSIFRADDTKGYLKYMQFLEWERYAFQITGLQKVFVLTGTASLIRASKLVEVHNKFNHYYDEDCITEDFAMTIDLKEVGTKMISPASINCLTETMPSTKLLYLQRRRWYLGALQQVFSRKITNVTKTYLFQQIMLSLSVICFSLVLFADSFLILNHQVFFSLFWLIIYLLFVIERVVSVWHIGWKARIIAGLILPELLYAYILQISYIGAFIQFISGSKGTWNHIN